MSPASLRKRRFLPAHTTPTWSSLVCSPSETMSNDIKNKVILSINTNFRPFLFTNLGLGQICQGREALLTSRAKLPAAAKGSNTASTYNVITHGYMAWLRAHAAKHT